MKTHIDLCSGIGGFGLAAMWAGYETVVFCEIDEFCQKVLRQHWKDVPIVTDVRELPVDAYRGADLLTAGFPCQDVSVAGKQQGIEGGKSRLWFDLLRVIRGTRPRWVVIENSPNLRSKGADVVLGGLEEAGYSAWPLVVGADHVGACHDRRRVWIVAHSNEEREPRLPVRAQASDACARKCAEDKVAHSNDGGYDRTGEEAEPQSNGADGRVSLGSNSQPKTPHSTGREDDQRGRSGVSTPLRGGQGIHSPACIGGTDAEENPDPALKRNGRVPDRQPHEGQSRRRASSNSDGSSSQTGNALRGGRAGLTRRRAGQEPPNGHVGLAEGEAEKPFQSRLEGPERVFVEDEGTWRQYAYPVRSDWWEFESPLLGRNARLSNRVDRVKSIGNSIVPQVAYEILKAIVAIDV